MSEYQYYEFQAVDQRLDQRAMAELRQITSRATITPTSLVNEYHFGDFKGDPAKLMERYFDAHLYYANWGTRRLMLRLPARFFPLASAEPYTAPRIFKAWAAKEHVILDFYADSEDASDFEEMEENRLASLLPLRSELMDGDLRSLYLAWLTGVQAGDVEEDEPEPAVPPGLGSLSAASATFADFLLLDPGLLKVATAASAKNALTEPSAEDLLPWLANVPGGEKDRLLVRLLRGEGSVVSRELLRRFRDDRARKQKRSGRSTGDAPPRRTAGELLAAWNQIEEERERQEAEQAARERERKVREEAKIRQRHLDALKARGEGVWREIETCIQTKQPKQYDRAVELLRDLQELAGQAGESLVSRIREIRERHRTKPSFIERLDKAGLPH